MTVPGTGLRLPSDYPEAGGVAIVMEGVNGNVYYQFSNPTGAFQGYQNNGNPAGFRGNPFTINSPISLDCGYSTCSTYFGGAIARISIRFTALDGDTQVGGFDFNDISLVLNGFTVGNWSSVNTERTSNDGRTSQGFEQGFGNNTLNTGWFASSDPGLMANVLSTGRTSTQVFDRDPNDNYWDFRVGPTLANTDIVTVAPGYSMDKTTVPPSVTSFATVGQQITFRYVVANIGSVPIRSLAVSDDKVSSVTCNKTVILDVPPSTPSPDSATCTGVYTVTQADIDRGSVTNIAAATGVPDFGSLGRLTDSVTLTGPAQTATLTLDKATTSTAFGAVGSTVTYTFRATNTGNVTLTNVTVTDPRIPGLSCSAASLAPNAQLNCSATYTVRQADIDAAVAGTALQNTATARGTQPNGTSVSVTDNVSLPGPAAAPALTVAKATTAPNFATLGQVIPYTITLRNTGNVTWPGPPAVTDPLAPVSCPAGAVAPGVQIICTANYTVTQANLDAGRIDNTASASITVGGVVASGQGSASLLAQRTTALVLDKRLAAASPSSFAAPGVTLAYEYVLRNTGNVTLNALAVSDNRTSVTCPATTLAPGASLTCTSTYATLQSDVDAGGVTNIASSSATAAGTGTAVTSANDQVTVPATQTPALTLDKTAPALTAAQFTVGATATYSYLVTNSGNVTLAGPVTVADDRAGSFTCSSAALAPGASVTCTRAYTLTSADIAAGIVVNVATASAGGTTSAQDSATIAPTLNPAISLSKTASPASVSSTATTITYTFAITNTGNTQIQRGTQPITVTDPRAGAVSCAAQPPILNAGASFNCTATTTATQAELDAGEVVNTAFASFPFRRGGQTVTVTSASDTAIVPVTRTAALTLTKTGPANFSSVGQVLTYGFTVTNIGNVTLTSARVTDPRIPGLSCTLGPIAPAAQGSCTGTYTVTQADLDAESIVNTATALGATAGGAAPSDDATVTTPVNPAIPAKSASLDKVADRTSFAAVGDRITYTFRVTNTGTQTLAGFTVIDALDPAFSCAIPSIAPGVTSTICRFTHTVTQADLDAGRVLNAASATQANVGTLTDSVSVPGPARQARLTASKTALGGFSAVGDTLRFGLTLTNTGNTTLTNVSVSDPLLASPGPACTIATLAPGAADTSCLSTFTYVVTQADVDAGRVVNSATATATPPAGVTAPAPQTATATATGPAQAPTMQLTKTPAGPYGAVGSTVSWTFSLQNTGNVTLIAPVVSDAATGFSCTLADLAPGATATTCGNASPLSTSRLVTQADVDAGNISNTARADATTAVLGTPVVATDTASTRGPAQAPSVSLVKTAVAGDPFDRVGDVVDYTYDVTNTGNLTLTAAIAVTDDRIPRVTCPGLPAGGLAPGGSLQCTGRYTVTQADLDAGSVLNAARAETVQSVVPVNPGDPSSVTVSATDTATVSAAQVPALRVEKRVKAGTPGGFDSVGDEITYEYLVTNTGNVTTTAAVRIADDRIPGLLLCAPAGLAPNAQAVCEQRWTATQAALDAGSVTNTATARTSFGGSPIVSAPDQVTVSATRSPELSLDKTLASATPDLFDVGTVLSYAYAVTNSGNVTIGGPLTVADNLAAVTCPATASLAPGGSVTCTATYTLTANDIALGSTTNTATARGSFDGASVASAPDSVTYPVGAAPALSIEKVALTTSFAALGDVVDYQFTLRNTGGAGLASDISVTDDRIGTFLCRAASLGVFSVGRSHVCTASYTITQDDLDLGLVTNNAVASTTFAEGTPNAIPVSSPGDSATVSAVETPALTVAKVVAAGPSPAAVGDVLTYRIRVTNSGNQTIRSIAVSDPRIPALSCEVGGAPAPANLTLAPTQAAICSGTYTVTQADVNAQALANTATAAGTDPQGAPVGGTATISHPLSAAAPAILTEKVIEPDPGAAEAFVAVGQDVTFRVRVRNTGNVTLNALSVTDDLVPGTCTIATLAPGASDDSCTFVYTTTQADIDRPNGPAPLFGGVTNTATATGQPANPGATPVSDDGAVFARGPLQETAFALAKVAQQSSFATAGEVLDYLFTVTNTGNITLTDVPVVDDDKIGAVTCGPLPGGTLAPGAFVQCSAAYTVTQADVDAGSVTNIASVSSPEVPLPTPAGPAEATATVPGTRGPAMTVQKTASIPSDATVGAQIVYTYDVTNTGNVTLTAVTPVDTHTSAAGPATLTLRGDRLVLDGGPAGGSSDAAVNGIWDRLGPGDSVRFTARYTVTQADVDAGLALENSVTVSAGSPPGTTPPTATDTVSVTVEAPRPGLTVLKDDLTGGLSLPPAPGDVLTYRVTVANSGNLTLTAPVLTDTLTDAAGQPRSLDAALALVSGNNGNATLDVGETWVYEATVSLTQSIIDAGGLSNTVTADAQDPAGGGVQDVSDDDGTGPSDPTVTPLARTPGLEVIKTADVSGVTAPPAVGNPVSFAITVANTGNTTLSAVALTDRLSRADGTALALTSGPVRTAGDNGNGLLDVGETWTYVAAYTLTQADIDAGGLRNRAEALAVSPGGVSLRDLSDDGVPGGGDDPTLVPLAGTAGIEGEKTLAAAPVTVGSTIVYRITLRNSGNLTLTGTGIAADTLTRADGTVLAPASGPSFLGATLGSGPGTLLPGEVASYDLQYVLTQADLDAGGLSNTATVTGTPPGRPPLTDITDDGDDGDGNTVDDPTVLTIPGTPALRLDKRLAAGSRPSFDAIGDVLNFEFEVTNTGNVTIAAPIAVTDPLITGAGGAVTCPPGPLAPLVSLVCTASYTVRQADLDAGAVVNSATAGDGTISSSPDAVTVPAQRNPGLEVVKTAAPLPAASFVVGAVANYTYVVRNTGNVTLTDAITVSDNLVPVVTCAPLPAGGLAPAASLTCVGSYAITAADVDLGSVTNLATASSGSITSAITSETVPDDAAPALQASKTAAAGSAFAAPGDVIDYVFAITNTGTRAFVRPVTIEDSLIGPVVCFTPSAADPDFTAGETVQCAGSYTVTQADVDRGFVLNEAFAQTTRAGGPPVVSAPVTETVAVTAAPGLALAKSATPASVTAAGQVVTFRLVATNTGNQTLRQVEATDPMLPGLSCQVGTLAPAATLTCDAPYTVTQTDLDRGTLVNTASVTGVTPTGAATTDDATTSVGLPAAAPAMILTKTATPSPFGAAGSTLTYGLTVTNTGNVTLSGIAVTDPMAPGLSCTVPSLAPAATSGPCAFSVTITPADVDRGEIRNTAAASGAAPDGTRVGDTAALVTPGPAASPGLEATKTVAPAASVAGTPLRYTLTLRNTGNVSLTPQPPVDTMTRLDGAPIALDAPFVLVAGDDGDGILAQDEVWTYTATRTLTQADINAGGVENSASVTASPPAGPPVSDVSDNGNDGDGNTVDDPTRFVVGALPALSVTKTVTQAGAAVGDTVIFTITALNTGNVDLTGIAVADTLTRRDGVQVAAAPPVLVAGSDPLVQGAAISWTVAHVLEQEDLDAGGLSNSATVSGISPGGGVVTDRSADGDPADGNTEDDPTELIIQPASGLDATKTLRAIGALAGETAVFDISVTNTGNVTLTSVTLTENLSRADGTVLVAPAPVFAAGSLGSPEGRLLPGETATWTLAYVLTQADVDAGGLANQILAAGETPTGSPVVDLSDDDPTPGGSDPTAAPVAATPAMKVVKTADVAGLAAPPAPGDVLVYRITVENTGNVSLTAPALVDSLTDAGGAAVALDAAPAFVSGDDGDNVLGVGETWVYDARVTLTAATLGSGGLSNTVTASATSPGGGPVSDVSDDGDDTDGNIADDPTVSTFGTSALVLASKTADRETAVAGETVRFTLTFQNNSAITYQDATFLDILPAGLVATPGSYTLNGAPTVPQEQGNRLIFGPASVAPAGVVTITLAARVSPSADPGTLTNRAMMLDALGQVVSNVATAGIRIVPEAVFDCSDVIGKVFHDRNGNGIQDRDPGRAALTDDDDMFVGPDGKFAKPREPEPTGEPGLAGVRIATVNGLLITTDAFGRFHVPCAALPKREGSNFTLKLDDRTLPDGLMVASENPRTMRLTAGKIAKMNFALQEGARVDIDLTSAAFLPGSTKAVAALKDGQTQLIRQIRKVPSIIHLTYVLGAGEQEGLAAQRLRAVERSLRAAWVLRGTYPLKIEKSVRRKDQG